MAHYMERWKTRRRTFSKLSGVARIVAAPRSCNAIVETVVQWNQQGPPETAGPQKLLLHVISVPATASDITNGFALITALASITDATQASPYVVQLDAGYYAFKDASVVIPAYVSLRGALVNSTTLASDLALCGSSAKPTLPGKQNCCACC